LAALLALLSAVCFASSAAALMASLGGAVLITLADRETPMPTGETAAAGTPRAEPAPT
jgi:hypothetical protein